MSNQTNAKGKAAAKAPARMSRRIPSPETSRSSSTAGGGPPAIWPPASSIWTTPAAPAPEAGAFKGRILGHWGTCPGQNFIYTHLNQVINKYDLDMIYLSGPGHAHGGQDYLDGSYTEIYTISARTPRA